MTIKTLPFCPQPGYSEENQPRRKVNQFGDGYQQRMAVGLNPLLRKFSLSFNLNHKKAVTLDQFFAEHAGVTAFYFPINGKQYKVVCPKWTKKQNKTHTLFSCEFEEVV